ncbi:MAG: hypothetical protein KC457_25410, partial [Myxococcales bacterium]|nr:hypothetical protein [Myxococcales bacterium]
MVLPLAPQRTGAPELVIALVGPTGIGLGTIVDEVRAILTRYDYHGTLIELAPLLDGFERYASNLARAKSEGKDREIDVYMRAGDD